MVIKFSRPFYALLFIAALFPYSPVLFPGSDVQPAIFLLAIAILLLKIRRIKVGFSDCCLLMLAILFLFNLSDASSLQLKKLVGPLLGVLLFIALRQLKHYDYSAVVVFSASVMFLGCVAQFFAPVVFEKISSFILPRYFYEHGYRGVTSFTPEPAFMSAIMVTCGFLITRSRDNGLVSVPVFVCVIGMIFLAVLMGKSATGFIFFIMLMSRILRLRTFVICCFAVASVLLFVDVENYTTRALVVFHILWDGTWGTDHSIMHRVSNLITVYYSLTTNFLGAGFGGFPVAGEEAHTYYQISTHLSSSQRAVSGASLLLVEQGWLCVIFLLILIYRIRNEVSFHGLVFAFLLIFSSFTIVFPPFWLILALDARVKDAQVV